MNRIPVFQKADGRTYRLCAMWRWVWEHGYAEPSEEKFNVLQVKVWWGWKTVEEEHIPSWAWIALGCVGYTDWKSKLLADHLPKEFV